MSLSPTVPQESITRWLPAMAAGLCAWSVFIIFGHTPLIRASALAIVIVGVALMLQRWGDLLAFAGSLALAFNPAFWSQTGGVDSLPLPMVAGAAALALVGAVLVTRLSRYPSVGVAVGLVIFAALFLTLFGTPRSLRLTTLLAAWLLFVLVESLLLTNPRPDEAPAAPLQRQHTYGLLLLLALGVANDSLFTLLIPAVALGLFLSKTRLPVWYWAAMLIISALGARGIAMQYLDSGWWLFPAATAEQLDYRIPYVMADGWRASIRWLYLIGLLIEQFTPFGLVLGVLGLARLSRWYPPLGVVTMVAYATYFVFGLVYFGRDSAVLLLPLLMIQALWITYAVHSFGQWLQRSIAPTHHIVRWLAPAAFTLLPLFMLLRITGVI
jgi:hypothetical protein